MRTVEEYLSITLDMLWHDAHVLMESERLRLFPIMGDLLRDKGEWKKLSELRTEPITNPHYAVESQIRDMQRKGFYFGIGGWKYSDDKDNEPLGTNFNQPILVTQSEYPGYFSKLFPFRLIQVTKDDRVWHHKNRIGAKERLQDFLEFHLKEHFNNDFKSYKSFLLSLQAGSGELVKDFMDSIKLWIENFINNVTPNSEGAIRFKSLFKDEKIYNLVIEELSKKDPWFDLDGNFIRKGKGNDSPQASGQLFLLLNNLGFTDIPKHYCPENLK
ncbi:MAG: hypothetical protein KF763_00910 [Cyclobacteriaceae bacterium]|nr:hypothetical protein [Cyclobacteriaceae bacterium]